MSNHSAETVEGSRMARLIRRLDSNDDLCPACGGMGRWESPDTGAVDTCPRCQGRGLVRRSGAAAAAAE